LRRRSSGANSIKQIVRGSGVGLDPNGIDKLLEPFHTIKAHGLGIGLAISRRSIIEGGHNGQLWLATDGPGATFGFFIPFREAITARGLGDHQIREALNRHCPASRSIVSSKHRVP
jgi:nitrogen fixation/metabolism regulation signal transduction histidine kinase